MDLKESRAEDEQQEYNIGSLDTSMDRYLEHHRLWRKRIPQDGSSLFRAVSEDLFSTQVHHYEVRLKCIEHMHLFAEDYSPLINMPLSKYLTHLKDPTTPGGMLEVEALARCYRARIIVFSGKDQEPVECQYGTRKIMLSLIGYQFDRVISEERRRLLGIVQAYVYKFLYSEVFNQPKVVEQAKAMLRKSDTLYYGVKGVSMQKNPDRTEKKNSHDLIPVPYRTAKAFEPAIYRNVAYDVYMNDHFKKYFDRSMNKQHQHAPFMTHNRLVERFGVKMHLPVSYLNPPDCRRVIVTLANSEELFAYYVGEDTDTQMHNVYLVKFGLMTKTTAEKMLDFPASLGRRPVTFAQLKRNTNIYRKLKPCLDASLQFFEERSSRRQRQQTDDPGTSQQIPLFRPYPPLMSPMNTTFMYSPPVDGYQSNSHWYPSHPSPHSTIPVLVPMNNNNNSSEQNHLQHRININMADHYEWTTNTPNLYSAYPTANSSSNFDTVSLNGSLSSGTSTNDSSPYPLLNPVQPMFFNPYMSTALSDQQQPFCPPPSHFHQPISQRLVPEPPITTMLHDASSNKLMASQPPFVVVNAPHPIVNSNNQVAPSSTPTTATLPTYHPIPIVPRVFMDPMNLSHNGSNVYFTTAPPIISPNQQSPSSYPIFCASPSPTHLTPWISASPPIGHSTANSMAAPYFIIPNNPQPPHFPFQQLI